ncbi:very short patch repair endonuclease [Mariniblastus sp.]|nr:very short patch repair endonuclease [Mariniblastus sp.]
MTDHLSSERRSWNMSRIKSKNTKPEIAIRSIIHSFGYRFTVNGPLNRSLPGKPDLALPRLNAVVFVHGCFWHRHGCEETTMPKTRTEWWAEKFQKTVERDRRNAQRLRRNGWSVITVWACQLHADRCEKLKARILKKLDSLDKKES